MTTDVTIRNVVSADVRTVPCSSRDGEWYVVTFNDGVGNVVAEVSVFGAHVRPGAELAPVHWSLDGEALNFLSIRIATDRFNRESLAAAFDARDSLDAKE